LHCFNGKVNCTKYVWTLRIWKIEKETNEPLVRALLDYVAHYKFIYVCMYVCK